MVWDSTLPEDLARKLIEAGWPKKDERIRNRIIGSEAGDLNGFITEMLTEVPALTRIEAKELLGWAKTSAAQPQLPQACKSGATVHTSPSPSGDCGVRKGGSETSVIDARERDAWAFLKIAPPAAAFTEVSAETAAFQTDSCLAGALPAVDTESVRSGMASPTRSLASRGGAVLLQGCVGDRGGAQGFGDGSGSETEELCDSVLQRGLRVSPNTRQDFDVRTVRQVDWSCGLDVVAEMERQREGAHCICVSIVAENPGTHPDFLSAREVALRLFQGEISVATAVWLTNTRSKIQANLKELHTSSGAWIGMKYRVHVSHRDIPYNIGVEEERKVLAKVEGLRDLFGGDRVFVSSEDWVVLSDGLRSSVFKDRKLNETVAWELPPMYVRIARGVSFEPGGRESFSNFDLSNFVPTSAAPGGIFAKRTREYIRTNYHETGLGGGRVMSTGR
uniref:Uncharacterized protein n=1 Tax=Chromera velia CCMP2878 TaxID=1169474 RepID=A0A0G4I0Z6_9ALVE|eukprot:Cvel_10073.t1-p1 / transcript=Cvel_10073.t1 / gene=Cvel_10073 / organism=Chromera_velia_CCMP2878 / gene_product=hypothetical protein / transcript_product=hypothetical protein / location=Cvel_scaffold599:58095-59435(-) / protein_length=447 / sequence_SO=supercontig / SO=protein_coding / is_pseudo=false